MAMWVHWFRRDLRVRDNTGLLAAARLAGGDGIVGVFIVDERWWPARQRKLGAFQAKFWLDSLKELRESLRERGIPLVVRTAADPVQAVLQVARDAGGGAEGITFNREYEPAQRAMDERLEREAAELKVRSFRDACILHEHDLLTGQGSVYSVFTPYKRAYLAKIAELPERLEPAGVPRRNASPVRIAGGEGEIPTLRQLGFEEVSLELSPGERAGKRLLEHFLETGLAHYHQTRDFPAAGLDGGEASGTSRLSAHLNAGTVSIRQAMHAALQRRGEGAATFLSELIWREFYRMILFHYPHTVARPFQAKYAGVKWSDDPRKIAAWREGRTGYPIVDAAMAQLRTTGYMHNRLRMIAAMFLTKHLDVHWTIGERHFMRTLIDYDQAANVGGWQWSASTGTDAAPYFRIMNPVLQSRTWDPDGRFIRHYLPALRDVPAEYLHAPWTLPPLLQQSCRCVIGRDYPAPIVDHAQARQHAIDKFRARSK